MSSVVEGGGRMSDIDAREALCKAGLSVTHAWGESAFLCSLSGEGWAEGCHVLEVRSSDDGCCFGWCYEGSSEVLRIGGQGALSSTQSSSFLVEVIDLHEASKCPKSSVLSPWRALADTEDPVQFLPGSGAILQAIMALYKPNAALGIFGAQEGHRELAVVPRHGGIARLLHAVVTPSCNRMLLGFERSSYTVQDLVRFSGRELATDNHKALFIVYQILRASSPPRHETVHSSKCTNINSERWMLRRF